MIDEHVGALGDVVIFPHSGTGHSFIIELVPLILDADFRVVVPAVQRPVMVDDAHQLVLHRSPGSSFFYFDELVVGDLSVVLLAVVVALDEAGEVQDEVLGKGVEGGLLAETHLLLALLAQDIVDLLLPQVLLQHVLKG